MVRGRLLNRLALRRQLYNILDSGRSEFGVVMKVVCSLDQQLILEANQHVLGGICDKQQHQLMKSLHEMLTIHVYTTVQCTQLCGVYMYMY